VTGNISSTLDNRERKTHRMRFYIDCLLRSLFSLKFASFVLTSSSSIDLKRFGRSFEVYENLLVSLRTPDW